MNVWVYLKLCVFAPHILRYYGNERIVMAVGNPHGYYIRGFFIRKHM